MDNRVIQVPGSRSAANLCRCGGFFAGQGQKYDPGERWADLSLSYV
jgi:hypothetical protein